MLRRQFLGVLGYAAVPWPLPALAQQGRRLRRIGVLSPYPADEPIEQARDASFRNALQALGWSEGSNLRTDYRRSLGNAELLRKHAEELVAFAPDVLLVTSSALLAAVRQATRTVPIVFVQVADPVGGGVVASLARPGGNATGFTPIEYSVTAKWLELLKQIAPNVTRVMVLQDAANPGSIGQLLAIQSAAPALGVELTLVDGRDTVEIERAVVAFSGIPNGGMIAPAIPPTNIHRDFIIALAAQQLAVLWHPLGMA